MKLRQFTWYAQAYYHRHRSIILISAIVGILFFLLLPHVVRVIPTGKKTTYIGRVGRFTLAQIPRDIQEKVSVGLTKSMENGDAVPALASSFTREEGGKAYRFTLHPKLFWQDGKPVTPEDVAYSFSDTEVSRSQNDILFRLVAKKQDETAIEPVLPVSFLSIVSQPLFRTVETRTVFFQKRQQVIGLGEYRITSIAHTGSSISELTLDSEEERLVYRFYPTEHHAIVAFKRGEIDQLHELLNIEDLDGWQGITSTKRVHTDQYVGIFFNTIYKDGENMVYSNRQLRQALNFALGKPEERIYAPISKLSWAYVRDEAVLEHFDQDMVTAVDLLSKTETPTKLVIDLQTAPSYSEIAEKAKRDWEELGNLAADSCKQQKDAVVEQCENKRMEVRVRISNFPDTQNYGVLIVGQQIPRDPDQYNLWHSTQATNITHYKNPKVDKLLEDGRRTSSRDERKLLYEEFQQIIVKDTPVIFYEPITTYTVVRKTNIF